MKLEAKKLDLEMIEVIKADVMQFLRNTGDTFDIIFCDPPYAFTQYEAMIRIILDRDLLKPDGCCIVEHHSVTKLEHIPERFEKRAYGQNIMSFFAKGMNE
jgi:16S rRNA G966 N2-methylase RsmD